MGLLSIYEIVQIIRKNILKIVALSMAIGLLTFCVTSSMQTYTCVLGFKYNNDGAKDGLAPDDKSKLDPYEIQNPVVISAALDDLGLNGVKGLSTKGLRQNIKISKVVTGLDSEVSKSAALLGNKVEIPATEFEMKLTYKHSLGDEFGSKMFGAIIKEYDKFLVDKYYSKATVADFAKIVKGSSADYIDSSDMMKDEIDKIVDYFSGLSEDYPDFRSKNTGYSFGELATLYQNLKDVQHAKYYGNIRAANLAKDPEMVIKSYQTKVKELTEEESVNFDISENYKNLIIHFYDSYKAAGLYRQAERVQTNEDSSNNRDKEVLYDFNVSEYRNTYDSIITSYVNKAINASDASHKAAYYNSIVDTYANDTVDAETKKRLLKINEQVFEELSDLSAKYCIIANESVDELYSQLVTDDLQYLIAPEVEKDIPVKLITVFVTIFAFGFLLILLLFIEFAKRFAQKNEAFAEAERNEYGTDKKVIDTTNLDELQVQVYEQYQKDFNEFYLVYQEMRGSADSRPHMETFIRWRSPELGMISPGKIIKCVSELNLFDELNEWIIKNVCKDIAKIGKRDGEYPIVHINCPRSELSDFKINDIIIRCLEETDIPADCLCLELNGKEISASLEEIMLIKKMGISVCVDRFENSDENKEIISVIEPEYVKMSLDILNSDMYATTDEDYRDMVLEMITYLSEIVSKCHSNGIKVCICGIEDQKQDKMIDTLAFDYKQGYYYSKPQKLSF